MAFQIGGSTIIDNSRNITGVSVTAEDLFNIPSGNTASRPTPLDEGEMYFNTETNQFELYDGSSWILVSTTAA